MTIGNTNILCKNCRTLNAPDIMFCGNCGKPVNGDDKSTIHLPDNSPIPPTQPHHRPLPPIYPIASKPQFWTRGKIIVLSATILLLLLFIGGGLILFAYQQGRNSVIVTPQPTTPPGTTPTTAGTQTPIPTPKVFPDNRPIPCLDCSTTVGAPYSIMLIKRILDTTHANVAFYFNVTNIGNNGETSNFAKMQLQNNNDGSITTGEGPGVSGYWDLGPNNSIIEIVNFSFMPTSGVQYTLMLATSNHVYEDEKFTFDK